MTDIGIELKNLVRHPGRVMLPVIKVYNVLIHLFRKKEPVVVSSNAINEIIQHASHKRTDISDHLLTLYAEALSIQPKLIVELGVRGGESTFVFERIARLTHAKLISVDIEDCSTISSLNDWIFVQQDDVKFAQDFNQWCEARGISPQIDFLFIDTSHLYDHTIAEIQHWFPLLQNQSKVVFHDTNMRKFYRRKDGTLGVAWANDRGVIAALEHYFQYPFQEQQDFVDFRNGWLIKHYAYSSGLTILEKITVPPDSQS